MDASGGPTDGGSGPTEGLILLDIGAETAGLAPTDGERATEATAEC